MPRRTWIDSKVDLLLAELDESGMHLDRIPAAEFIRERIRVVASLLRITEPTARRYLDDDAVRDLAHQLLFEFVDEQPGADLMELARTVPLSLVLVGAIVAALAEAMQIRAANAADESIGDVVAVYGQTLSGIGQLVVDEAVQRGADANDINFPPALLRRAARYLDAAATQLTDGGRLPAGVAETARDDLVAVLQRDASGLNALTAHT